MSFSQMSRAELIRELEHLMLSHGPQHLTDGELIALVGLLRVVVDRLHHGAPRHQSSRMHLVAEMLEIMETESPDDLLLPEVSTLLAVLRPFRDRQHPAGRVLQLVKRWRQRSTHTSTTCRTSSVTAWQSIR